jgi:predicted phosphate transport protein (TIGR00153 family)
MIQEIHEIEHDTDEIQVDVRQALFDIEPTLNPIDAIFLYKVIQWTGDIADNAQQVGNRLQLLLAK